MQGQHHNIPYTIWSSAIPGSYASLDLLINLATWAMQLLLIIYAAQMHHYHKINASMAQVSPQRIKKTQSLISNYNMQLLYLNLELLLWVTVWLTQIISNSALRGTERGFKLLFPNGHFYCGQKENKKQYGSHTSCSDSKTSWIPCHWYYATIQRECFKR